MVNHPNRSMHKVIERVDIHGRVLWLPPLAVDAAAALKSMLQALLSKELDWDHAAEIIDIRGGSLVLKVNHHGPQDYLEWSIAPRRDTWMDARIADLLA